MQHGLHPHGNTWQRIFNGRVALSLIGIMAEAEAQGEQVTRLGRTISGRAVARTQSPVPSTCAELLVYIGPESVWAVLACCIYLQ